MCVCYVCGIGLTACWSQTGAHGCLGAGLQGRSSSDREARFVLWQPVDPACFFCSELKCALGSVSTCEPAHMSNLQIEVPPSLARWKGSYTVVLTSTSDLEGSCSCRVFPQHLGSCGFPAFLVWSLSLFCCSETVHSSVVSQEYFSLSMGVYFNVLLGGTSSASSCAAAIGDLLRKHEAFEFPVSESSAQWFLCLRSDF